MTASGDMKISAISPWFGGKRSMAADIVRELGPHTAYFEPFCGSMAVLLAKEPAKYETVNDLHGDLTNLARVLQDDELAPRLYDRLQRTLFCDALLDDAQAHIDGDTWTPPDPEPKGYTDGDGDRAFWFFISSWMARNGVAGTDRNDYQVAVRWTANGGSSTTRWKSAIDSIPAWHRRLSNVVVLNRDAFDIIPRFDDVAGTAVYADPPYHVETTTAARGKGNRYLHDFKATGGLLNSGDDHSRLRDQLAAFRRARVVVSYYDCPQIRALYAGWTFVEHKRTKNIGRQNGAGAVLSDAPEVLILNGPSLAAQGELGWTHEQARSSKARS